MQSLGGVHEGVHLGVFNNIICIWIYWKNNLKKINISFLLATSCTYVLLPSSKVIPCVYHVYGTIHGTHTLADCSFNSMVMGEISMHQIRAKTLKEAWTPLSSLVGVLWIGSSRGCLRSIWLGGSIWQLNGTLVLNGYMV